MINHYIPSFPLSNFVELFWLYQGQVQPSHSLERALPTGTMELVISLQNETLKIYDNQDHKKYQSFKGSLISGVHSESFIIDTSSQISVMGIHFKPAGAFPFLNLPAGELHNTTVSLDNFWGGKAEEMRERLLAAPSSLEKFKLLEHYLLSHIKQPLKRHPAIEFALKKIPSLQHSRAISELTDQIGLSSRRFIELFNKQVGLSPKLFSRVCRFQYALRIINSTKQMDWSEIALECGYFDQAHFIHEFKAFSGLSPTVYKKQKGENLNHVPIG
jgi:AraC-like DNA-binding protein